MSHTTPASKAFVETSRLQLRLFVPGDGPRLLDFYRRNKDHLEPWDPARAESFYTSTVQNAAVQSAITNAREDRAYRFVILRSEATAREEQDENPALARRTIVGIVSLNNVVRGVFQNAYLGFNIDGAHQGKGYATEAVAAVVAHAFGPLRLHRVQAAVQPHNAPSLAVMRRTGFREEGRAASYLKIGGEWRDHILFARTAEDPTTAR